MSQKFRYDRGKEFIYNLYIYIDIESKDYTYIMRIFYSSKFSKGDLEGLDS